MATGLSLRPPRNLLPTHSEQEAAQVRPGFEELCSHINSRATYSPTFPLKLADEHTALGKTLLPQTVNSLLKTALEGSRIPDDARAPAVLELLRVSANLCMDHGGSPFCLGQLNSYICCRREPRSSSGRQLPRNSCNVAGRIFRTSSPGSLL